MAVIKFSQRVDFTYFIGAGISLIFFIFSMYFYHGDGLPIGFSLASLGAYSGVIIRGLIDSNSWGRTQKRLKISALVGFTSVFLVFFIGTIILLTKSFEISKDKINLFILFGGIEIMIIYLILYLTWFKNLTVYIYSIRMRK